LSHFLLIQGRYPLEWSRKSTTISPRALSAAIDLTGPFQESLQVFALALTTVAAASSRPAARRVVRRAWRKSSHALTVVLLMILGRVCCAGTSDAAGTERCT
jgi:hypothetical protein